jgi:hypothetical protein
MKLKAKIKLKQIKPNKTQNPLKTIQSLNKPSLTTKFKINKPIKIVITKIVQFHLKCENSMIKWKRLTTISLMLRIHRI